jgi:hypothetical protein
VEAITTASRQMLADMGAAEREPAAGGVD